ncbi:helix-turn-helix domain-containing protein [Bosea sp. TAB14]|uniref:helix-turn-helix domain-containing protein n=1 Tax=Bosea sp. TAB14 TaxID=3237481 RepID=UPI003F91AD4A
MTRASWPELPPLLAEIAEVAGIDAALAIAEAKGGQQVFVVAHLRPDNWLIGAVGIEKARLISDHFCSGRLRQKLTIPLGPVGSYQALRRRTNRALEEAASRGESANQMAATAGVTTRTVHRFRSRRRGHNTNQLKLF